MSPPRRDATGALGVAMAAMACAMLAAQPPGAGAEIPNVAISAPADMTFSSTGPIIALGMGSYGIATVEASVDTDLVMANDAPAAFTTGMTTITWTVTDPTGRTEADTQAITVVDIGKPTIASCPPDIRVKSSVPVARGSVDLGTIPESDWDDNDPDGLKLANNAMDVVNDGDAFPVGKTPVTWTLTDGEGNFAECVQRVYVAVPSIVQSIPGDGNVDGTRFGSAMAHTDSLLIVGHEYSSLTAAKAGEVTAYSISDGTQANSIQHPNPYKNQNFGAALAILPGSPNPTLAVGAPGHDTNSGEVVLYDAVTGDEKNVIIRNPNTAGKKADEFGASLAAVGDHLLVGAPEYDAANGNRKAGRAYVFDQAGSIQHVIANPSDGGARDQFGRRVAAMVDDQASWLYIGANKYTERKMSTSTSTLGVVHIYNIKQTADMPRVSEPKHALAVPGTGKTDFGVAQLRPSANGKVYVGEPNIKSGSSVIGKIRIHTTDGARDSTINAPACCEVTFGRAFDLDDRLLYAGNSEVATAATITAFALETRAHVDSFQDNRSKPAGHITTRFGAGVEHLGDGKVAIVEHLDIGTASKARVHILDLSTLAPTPTSGYTAGAAGGAAGAQATPAPGPTQGGQGGSGSETMSKAQSQATAPAQPTASVRLAEPTLASIGHVSPGTVRLTYDMRVDPFEVDSTDYMMTDGSLEIVSADVEGYSVTLTYVNALTGKVPAGIQEPGVELIGGIGHY